MYSLLPCRDVFKALGVTSKRVGDYAPAWSKWCMKARLLGLSIDEQWTVVKDLKLNLTLKLQYHWLLPQRQISLQLPHGTTITCYFSRWHKQHWKMTKATDNHLQRMGFLSSKYTVWATENLITGGSCWPQYRKIRQRSILTRTLKETESWEKSDQVIRCPYCKFAKFSFNGRREQ